MPIADPTLPRDGTDFLTLQHKFSTHSLQLGDMKACNNSEEPTENKS